LRKSDKQRLCRVSSSGEVSTIIQSASPFYGPDVCPNGDIVHHPSTSRLERRCGKTGEVLATIEGNRGRVIGFEANSYLTSGQDGHVYFSSKTCMYRWNTQEATVECIAGHPKAGGRRDGFAADARFTHLKRPVLTRTYAYVREADNRFCRLNLETFEVTTLQLRGIDPSGIETYGVTPDGKMMFVVFGGPLRIYVADTTDALESTFFSDMELIDWSSTHKRTIVEFIAGRDRKIYRADRRILEARCEYFRSMLSGGMRETNTGKPIDLGEDVGDALSAIFRFLHTDHFVPVSPPSAVMTMGEQEVLKVAKFVLEVHNLADRFLLPRLGNQCEVFLSDFALRKSLILPLLANVAESPNRASLATLETACWTGLEDNWKEIVESNESILHQLVEQGHPLVKELLQAANGIKRIVVIDDESTQPPPV